jgi:hypothetical protein
MPAVVQCNVGAIWYVTSAQFPTAYAARRAWELIERRVPRGTLGLYRHGPEQLHGQIVTVVSLQRAEVERCARLLVGGQDYELDEMTKRALVMRRARVVLAAQGQGSGRLKIRRPERGARLSPDGDLSEPGGQG